MIVDIPGGLPVELTAAQERLWAEGKKGQKKVRKQVKEARKKWHEENLDESENLTEDYDEAFGGDDE